MTANDPYGGLGQKKARACVRDPVAVLAFAWGISFMPVLHTGSDASSSLGGHRWPAGSTRSPRSHRSALRVTSPAGPTVCRAAGSSSAVPLLWPLRGQHRSCWPRAPPPSAFRRARRRARCVEPPSPHRSAARRRRCATPPVARVALPCARPPTPSVASARTWARASAPTAASATAPRTGTAATSAPSPTPAAARARSATLRVTASGPPAVSPSAPPTTRRPPAASSAARHVRRTPSATPPGVRSATTDSAPCPATGTRSARTATPSASAAPGSTGPKTGICNYKDQGGVAN